MLMSFGNAARMVRIVEKERKGQEEKLQTLSVHVANEPRHSNAQSRSSIFSDVFRVAWNQQSSRRSWLWGSAFVCVCMFTYSVFIGLTHKQSVVFRNWLYAKFVNWRDCVNAGCSKGPTKESRRGTLPWHVTRQRWLLECLNERPESKELWLIYLQVILVARISKQYLLLHVGNWHIPLAESYWEFSSLDTRDTVDVCWCHLETQLKWSQWSKRKASHCIGIGTWCTWI